MSVTRKSEDRGLPIYADDVPVEMPELPELLAITTPEQLRALGDEHRMRMTHLIKQQPMTAKQIAERLKMTPGTVGHHLHVLERAGLVRVIALRMVRGTLAKYYARTARVYGFQSASDPRQDPSIHIQMADQARQEMLESLDARDQLDICETFFPHARVSRERLRYYYDALRGLALEFSNEPSDAEGKDHALFLALFTSPPSLQTSLTPPTTGQE